MKVNVAQRDQRTEKTNDGRKPEDGNMDCVAVSLAAMLHALVPDFTVGGQSPSGDYLHDLVYGEGYVGMQDPAHYVHVLATHGVTMTRVTGHAADLVERAAAAIEGGHPVLLSIPSDWNDEPPHSQYAHMVAGCDVSADAQHLTAMNPWGGFYQTHTLAWWTERLAHCSYQGIWILQHAAVAAKPKPASPATKPAIKPAPVAHVPPVPPTAPAPSPIYKPLPAAPAPAPKPKPAAAARAPQDVEGTLVNIFKLFALARAYQSLSPAQRAVLRLVEGLVITAVVAAMPIVADALSRNTVNWADVARAAVAAGATAVGMAILKYAKAHADPAL